MAADRKGQTSIYKRKEKIASDEFMNGKAFNSRRILLFESLLRATGSE